MLRWKAYRSISGARRSAMLAAALRADPEAGNLRFPVTPPCDDAGVWLASRFARWRLRSSRRPPAYGLFEAGWLRTRVLEVEIEGLPEALDGLRIAHLSDFHLGVPSRGRVATERAVAWVAERRPDLVCITGDLVSHPRGVPLLRRLLGSLERPFVVLGNHDVAVTRDPFSRAAELDGLADVARAAPRRGGRRRAGRGSASRSSAPTPRAIRAGAARPWELVDATADLRILLCHFPGIDRRLPDRRVPPRARRPPARGPDRRSRTRGGRLTLAHPRRALRRGPVPRRRAA